MPTDGEQRELERLLPGWAADARSKHRWTVVWRQGTTTAPVIGGRGRPVDREVFVGEQAGLVGLPTIVIQP
jgi:hypothetical protein